MRKMEGRSFRLMKTFWNIYIIGIVAALAIVGCGRGTGEQELTHEEVAAINEQVLEKAIGQPDSALMMIEQLRAGNLSVLDTTGMSLQWRGPLPDYRCDYLRAKVYAQTLEGMWLDSAIIIGERLMTTDAAREDLAYRQDVLEMLINACRQHRDDELAIHWLAQLIDLCHQNGDETEALRTEADLGLMLSGIGRADEGLAKIDSVLTLLKGKRKFNELDATIIALKRKVNVIKNIQQAQQTHPQPLPVREGSGYTQEQKTNEAQTAEVYTPLPHREGQGVGLLGSSLIIAAAQQMLDLLADYEQHPDEYHDGTYREPPEHLRPGYIDFYRAQAYMFMVEAGGGGALSLFENTSYAKTFSARKDMAPTYGLLGQYDKMLAIHDEQEARLRQQSDTVCAEYATILRDRAMAAEARGRHAEANAYHRRYEALTATLNDRLLQGKANLYAARFHAAEQQREIERGRARAGRAAMLSAAFGIVAIIALLFAAYGIRQRRKTDRKNRVLAREISEAIEYKEKFRALEKQLLTPPRPAEQESQAEQEDEDTSAPAVLFSQIAQAVRDEQLYLDPQFDRQAVADRFGVSIRQIGTAFSQGSPYKSLPGFIRDLRLEHACRLLVTRPDMSIREVGEASGFTNNSTFCSDFMKKYEITPTVYRQNRQQEQ